MIFETPAGASCATHIRTHVSQEDLESLYDHVVNPFYETIQNDNNVRHYIDSGTLPGLKIKQTTFILRFLTSDLASIAQAMKRISSAHRRIHIDTNLFTPYFFIWSELLFHWMGEHKGVPHEELCQWRAKIFALFARLASHHSAHTDTQAPAHPTMEETHKENLAQKVRDIHAEQVRNKTSATEFLSGFDYDSGMIDELHELETEATEAIDDEGICENSMGFVTHIFSQYARLLENTYEFKELGFALNSLSSLITSGDVQSLYTGKLKERLELFIPAILEDIRNWRTAVFVSQDAIDVHYLDASLFSSIAQLELLLSPEETSGTGDEDVGDIELF